jgi:very-short-patch-repair endonuclease
MSYLGRSVDQAFYFGASPKIKARAKKLRKRMTYTEKVLWQELRKNRLRYFYFRRQHPISRFIVDFYCHELRLVIEVDGSYHYSAEQREKDLNRTAELEKFGIKVIRFDNNEIIRNIRKVTSQLHDEVKKQVKSTTTPHLPTLSTTTP